MTKPGAVRPLPTDDIRKGMFVCVLSFELDLVPCCVDPALSVQEVRPARAAVRTFAPNPLRVVSVCLPFVLTKRYDRTHEVVDLRRERLAQVPEEFARELWKARRADDEREKKRSS